MKRIVFILLILLIPIYASADRVPDQAKEIKTDTSNFDNHLSASEDTVQKALDVLEEIDVNDAVDSAELDNLCSTNDRILSRAFGVWGCKDYSNWDAAYTHSQIAGGDSVHVSTTENTNWDSAYSHIAGTGTAVHGDTHLLNTTDQIDGALTIDGDNAEALLVRKDGDGGDILVVNTVEDYTQIKAAGGSWTVFHAGTIPGTAWSNIVIGGAPQSYYSNFWTELAGSAIYVGREEGFAILAIPGSTTSATNDVALFSGNAARVNFGAANWTVPAKELAFYTRGDTSGNSWGYKRMAITDGGTANGYVGFGKLDQYIPSQALSIIGGSAIVADDDVLGAEMFQDGDFDGAPAGVWTLGSGWSLTGTQLRYSGSDASSSVSQTNANLVSSLKSGKWYKFTYTVAAQSSPWWDLILYLDGVTALNERSINQKTGTFTYYFTPVADNVPFTIRKEFNTDASNLYFDNFSLKELKGGNFTIGGTYFGNSLDVSTHKTDGVLGITDNTSYWLCTASDCATTCQVTISGGIITGCP